MGSKNTGRPPKKMNFISPNGDEIEVVGLKAFCLANGLTITRMSELANGKRDQYKGWTVSDSHDTGLPVIAGEKCKSVMIPVDAYEMAKESAKESGIPLGVYIADIIEIYSGGYIDNTSN